MNPAEPVSRSAPTRDPRPTALTRLLVAGVRGYQRWIGPALLSRCRFHPSCSVYAVTALERHGARRGGMLAVRRLLRCQPFHPGGFDPVPPAPSRGG
jgi:putative membrane protein insertion efficiency factor